MDSDASACVGFIGLGLLGQAMALRLAAQGIDLDASRAITARAGKVRIEWVDAPVSVGPAAAADAALTVMVGGEHLRSKRQRFAEAYQIHGDVLRRGKPRQPN